ncbi:ABC transporter substrate-binding protein [Actinomyces massiliensis]|uniref:ABC transporter, substrate-binding protein, family 5 n=1 Tax=Actinomyces massiliensis F0489 TaxID=1125718 RepID=J0MX78_9ACTO|nr:ABC transporter substrate-binding protein [Actinomyces massiliensis]EJF38979.1 ABC transporter, substrate-binding protein, family 5 [Actinomyces massiliensis F0489]WLD72831.1 ABC transporter substrate-binding protein [Actinomyces massiliensis]
MAISTPRASRRDFIRLTSTMGMAAGFAAALAACGGSSGGSGASGAGSANPDGTITAGISYELGTSGYDPMTTTAGLTVAANWHTLEGLTELDAVSREAYAALGKDLPMKVDDTTYEVALRDGAKFSDGSDVTVEDVVFSFERVLDPANNSLYSQFLTFLESVTAKDDTTVTIKTKHPYSLVAERLSTVKIVPKAVVEADPKAFDMNPIGSGPYKMTDNSAASQTVVFERNDNYNGSHPALAKKMTWQVLPDDTTRTNAITSSTVQAIDTVPATNLSAMTDPVVVSADKGFSLVFVMFNHQGAFADVKARQAIMYALDYEKICTTGMGTLATAATCFVQEEHPAYKKASTVYSYDADKAKSLLAEAGITSIETIATDHGFFSGARPIIKENLEALGVSANFTEKKSKELYDYIKNGDKWDIAIAPGDPSVFGNDADLLMRWWYSADLWANDRMHWKGTEAYTKLQAILDEAVQVEGDAQIAKWQEAFDLIAENVPLYPIFHRTTPTAYNNQTLVSFRSVNYPGLSFVDVGSTQV